MRARVSILEYVQAAYACGVGGSSVPFSLRQEAHTQWLFSQRLAVSIAAVSTQACWQPIDISAKAARTEAEPSQRSAYGAVHHTACLIIDSVG